LFINIRLYGVGTKPGSACCDQKYAGRLDDCGQSMCFPVYGKPNAFIAMFDRWNKQELRESRYVWLPVLICNGRIEIQWHAEWDLTIFKTEKAAKNVAYKLPY